MNNIEQINQIIELNNVQKIIEQANKLSRKLDPKVAKLGFDGMFDAIYGFYASFKEQNYPTKNREELEVAINKVVVSTLEILRKIEVDEYIKEKIRKAISYAKLEKAIEQLVEITKKTTLHDEAIVISFQFTELKNQIDKTILP